MNKTVIYGRYFYDYLKHLDFASILASINYIIFRKSHSSDRIVKTSIGYFFCRKNTNDFQFTNYYYEWGVKKFILDRLDKFDVFIDGGACIGDYSILLAKKNKRCFAIEPLIDNFEVLKRNVELNKLEKQISIFMFGLGDCNKEVKFVLDSVSTGSSHISSDENNDSVSGNIRKAHIKKLDDLYSEFNLKKSDRILMKLDVEGMELEAIKGAQEFIKFFPDICLILEDKFSGKSEIIDALNQLADFEVGIVDYCNIFAIKK